MSMKDSAEIPIMNCKYDTLQSRAKKWVDQLRTDNDPMEIITVSTIDDAT